MDTILDRYTTYYIGGTDRVPFVCLGKERYSRDRDVVSFGGERWIPGPE